MAWVQILVGLFVLTLVTWYSWQSYRIYKMATLEKIETPHIQASNFPSSMPVWTYWEGTPSSLVKLCLERITESCKLASNSIQQFTHIHLDKQNISQYVSDLDTHICNSLNASHLKSDIIRLSLLLRYGGFWLDASLLVLVPLDQLFVNFDSTCFTAYFNPQNSLNVKYPVIETSVMYAPPKHSLIQEWLAETDTLQTCTEIARQEYVNNLQFQKNFFNLNKTYHFVYFTLLSVLHKKKDGIQSFNNVRLYNTKINKYFCFQSYKLNDFQTLTIQDFLAKYSLQTCTMIKFIASERAKIDKQYPLMRNDCFLKNIPWRNTPIIRPHADKILKQIYQQTHLIGGKQDDEQTEQLMSVQFIPSSAKVLELGSNIGRNTLVIASLLFDQRNLVTLECDQETVVTLRSNRAINNMQFHIEPVALSQKKLVMSHENNSIERSTKPREKDNSSELDVPTISVKALKAKYPGLTFNTLVADIEGALYYILIDEPELLDDIQLVLMENDYRDIQHKKEVDRILTQKGLHRFFVKQGGWGPCTDFFWEAWRK